MENILRFIVFVTSDLLGQFEPSYDPSHFTLSTLININDDLLLKRLIDITDFFFLNGIPQEINFLDFTPQKIETLLPDILLQLVLFFPFSFFSFFLFFSFFHYFFYFFFFKLIILNIDSPSNGLQPTKRN